MADLGPHGDGTVNSSLTRVVEARCSLRKTAASGTTTIVTARLVLLVGGDAGTKSICEVAAHPVGLVRAEHLSVALDFVRTMRPAVVLAAANLPPADAGELQRASSKYGSTFVALSDGKDDAVASLVARALRGPDEHALPDRSS